MYMYYRCLMDKNNSLNNITQASVLEVAMETSLPTEILNAIDEKFGTQAAQETSMSTSVGGIGPLLRDRVISQANRGLKVTGVCLLYDTVWAQAWHGWNHLYLERKSIGHYLRDVLEQTGLSLDLLLFDNTTVKVNVWKAAYSAASVYFLDCPEIANVVYPCEEDAPPLTQNPHDWAEKQRLKQSWLAGRGALALVKHLAFKPDFIIQSETPTLFAHPRLYKDEFQKDPFFSQTKCIFNDHTPLEYAHPIWPRSTLDLVKMDPAIYKPFIKNDKIDVTQLLVAKADGVFGVAEKHAHVMRAMPSLKEYSQKIKHITNGVSQDPWQKHVFQQADSMSDQNLLAAKDKLKKEFTDWIWRRACLWPTWAKTMRNKPIVLWTRRITSYKRLDLLHTLFKNPDLRKCFLETGIVLIVGGRVYQRDNVSEKMVYNLVELLNQDQELGDRIIFLQNFNVFDAPRLFYGADGAIMLSNDGREASATGFMKAQMNGGVIIANPDGAIPEFVTFKGKEKAGETANGFGVSYTNGEPDIKSFMKALEDFSAMYKNSAQHAAMMRAALKQTSKVSIERTTDETIEFYKRILEIGN